jgi:hypothetical protein
MSKVHAAWDPEILGAATVHRRFDPPSTTAAPSRRSP